MYFVLVTKGEGWKLINENPISLEDATEIKKEWEGTSLLNWKAKIIKDQEYKDLQY